ncbi:MAG: hypothetical protein EP330_02680 [Deltaproteobacteria bacterium]|nr:MAG: hypothetical protein EP330_02680 [Deltaproteobacteria bacterium]
MNRLDRRRLLERALEAQCDASLSRLRAELLMETLAELGENKRTLQRDHDQLRRDAETIETQRQQLTELNQELELFSFGVAHDLRQPLVGARMLLQALPAGAACAAVDDALVEALDRIEGLLCLARLKSREFEVTTVDLSDLCERLVERQRQLSPDLRADVTIEAGLALRTDERVASLLFENLLSNAFRYGHADGKLALQVFSRPSVDGLVVGIADEGPGLSPELARRAFLPFHRAGGGGGGGGVGLGLALVDRAARRLGGAAWYEDRAGGGGCFLVRLPTAQP